MEETQTVGEDTQEMPAEEQVPAPSPGTPAQPTPDAQPEELPNEEPEVEQDAPNDPAARDDAS